MNGWLEGMKDGCVDGWFLYCGATACYSCMCYSYVPL